MQAEKNILGDLTSEAIDFLYNKCLMHDDDSYTSDSERPIIVYYGRAYIFDPKRIRNYTPIIRNLVSKIRRIKEAVSFDYLSYKNDGSEWTYLYQDIIHLVVLGLATEVLIKNLNSNKTADLFQYNSKSI